MSAVQYQSPFEQCAAAFVSILSGHSRTLGFGVEVTGGIVWYEPCNAFRSPRLASRQHPPLIIRRKPPPMERNTSREIQESSTIPVFVCECYVPNVI